MVCIYTGDDQNVFSPRIDNIIAYRYTPYVIIYYFFFYFLGTSRRLTIILITTQFNYILYNLYIFTPDN